MQKPGPQQQAVRPQQMQQVQQQKPQQQQQPGTAQRQQQVVAQQQQQNLRQQAQQFLNQQQPAQAQQPPPLQKQHQPKIELKTEEKPPIAVVPTAPPAMDTTNGNDNEGDTNSIESTDRKQRKANRPFWLKKDGKINKKERLRRRNQRLRKILQPKNALMVLNELIGSAPYNLSESPDMYEGTIFRCTVHVDGIEHLGIGKSKPSAKTAAAEAALKHMVLSKLKNLQAFDANSVAASVAQVPALTLTPASAPAPAATSTPTPVPAVNILDVDVEKMDVDSEDGLGGISWSHVACYALHKLLSSWDEGTNIAEKLVQVATGGPISAHDVNKTFEKKPAKKLPEAAGAMNPIMLLNQMHPNAIYEEVSKTGSPPNVQFTIKCTVVGEAFLGTGSTKKTARKMCAFAACQKVLGIQYPQPFLEEQGFNEDAISVVPVTSMPVSV